MIPWLDIDPHSYIYKNVQNYSYEIHEPNCEENVSEMKEEHYKDAKKCQNI